MKPIKLFVDDVRNPREEGWVIARTFDEAVELLDSCAVSELALDYNLGEDTYRRGKTGASVLEYIGSLLKYKEDFRLPEISVHSSDPGANLRMEGQIGILRAIARRPFNERKNPAQPGG